MNLETKAKIIYQFASENNLDAAALLKQAHEILAEEFIQDYEKGVALANLLVYEYVSISGITETGRALIEETYERVCSEMEVDSEKEYEDISDLHDEWRNSNEEE
jgi:hypothetical protein